MKILTVTGNEAGQRLDKLLAKYMELAPKSFLYKMIRKKNITLNGKRCEGAERLAEGDEIRLFLSDETIEKFSKTHQAEPAAQGPLSGRAERKLDILYEDDHILLINKPAGMLSQKAAEGDVSLEGRLTPEQLKTFRPSVCNRLDRNTSGLILAGKSLAGLQAMAKLLKDRSVHKYYLCVVKGQVSERQRISGFLLKNEKTNQVTVSRTEKPGSSEIITEYRPVKSWDEEGIGRLTLLEAALITGRTHQIRAHLASIGHPLAGDGKYGDSRLNDRLRRKYGISHQMLHSCRMEFPELSGPLAGLSGRIFEAPLPELFMRVIRGGAQSLPGGPPPA